MTSATDFLTVSMPLRGKDTNTRSDADTATPTTCFSKAATVWSMPMLRSIGRNRRIASSPAVRPPSSSRDLSPTLVALAVGTLANSPAPIVPAPTASDLLKKERRLRKLFKGLTLSSELSSRVSTFMAGSFALGFDVELVNSDAVDLSVDFIRGLATPVASAAIAHPRDFVVLLVRGGSLPLWR